MSIPAAFGDFFLGQTSAWTNRQDQVREIVSYRTTLLRRFLNSGSIKFHGGVDIRSRLQALEQTLTHAWSVDDVEAPTQPQTIKEIIAYWRFIRTSATWDDPTMLLNNSMNSEKEREVAIIDLKKQIERQAWMDMMMQLERYILAAPNVAMESSTPGGLPTSLGAIISECTNTVPLGFTNVQGLPPATYTGWQNQKLAYVGEYADASDSTNQGDLLPVLSKMSRLVHFEGLPMMDGANKESMPAAIYTSINGVTLFEEAMRNKQDTLVYVGRQDPTYPKPTVHGIPMEWIDYLSTAPMYPTGASNATYSYEGDTSGDTNAGPRYNFLNFDSLKLFFHTERFFFKNKIQEPDGMPHRHTSWIDTFVNMKCDDRRSQGVVYPGTSDVAAAYRS